MQRVKHALVFLLVAGLLICAGSSIYYFYGYKDRFWIEAFSYLPIIFGWLCFLYPLIVVHLTFKNKNSGRPSAIGTAGHAIFFIVYPAWVVALVAGFIELHVLSDKRVEKILASDEVGYSKARVVRIEERRTKSVSRTYAVIEYDAAGERVQQAIRDESRLYRPDQEIDIRYAVKYPDMFALVGSK